MQLYSSGIIKPNHHYVTHVSECVQNFGPLHNFWMFLYERLNKVLKSFKTNNHGQGKLETTFFYVLPPQQADKLLPWYRRWLNKLATKMCLRCLQNKEPSLICPLSLRSEER